MLIIAGTHSGCGKSTVVLGLLAALKFSGHDVQPFKAGPDFIDTGLHSMIAGRPSRNLDLWMCGVDYVRECVRRHCAGAGLAVTEGVMGFFDGGERSTAALAKALGIKNIVLVVDASGMGESAGAIVRGFNSEGGIRGVIFNRVAGAGHYEKLKSACRGVEVLGYLPRDAGYSISARHLGLTVAEERPISEEALQLLAEAVIRHIDIKRVRELAETAKDGKTCSPALESPENEPGSTVNIAVARDRAFCFYYEDNLDMLRDAGARILPFSPLSDGGLPADADAVYLGGGYPELYARELCENKSMTASIRNWAEAGRPVFAECGGFMYLGEGIRSGYQDEDIREGGEFFHLCGVLPMVTGIRQEPGGTVKGRPSLGYREAVFSEDCMLGEKNARLRGHEFHYSQVLEVKDGKPGVRFNVFGEADRGEMEKKMEIKTKKSSALYKSTLAGYTHFHFGSNPRAAENMVRSIRRSKKERKG